jgi:hypothetical protein
MESKSLPIANDLQQLIAASHGLWSLDAAGLTRSQTAIPALLHHEAYATEPPRTRVLLLSGLAGEKADTALALDALKLYLDGGEALTGTVALSAVPCANPDGMTLGVAPENGAGGRPAENYPPIVGFFNDRRNPEQRYLWRWVGLQAPDLILEVQAGEAISWVSSASATLLSPTIEASRMEETAGSFLAALGSHMANGLGAVPGLRLTTPAAALPEQLSRLWSVLQQTPGLRTSPARRELYVRSTRPPLGIARLMATIYGHHLDPVVYTQGMSLSARLRLARLDPTYPDPAASIADIVAPYVDGDRPWFDGEPGTPALAGLIWAMQLAESTRERRYADLLVQMADRYQPGADGGAPPPSDADFRTEDMFMNGAMLGRAFRLTGETRYLDLLTRFLLAARTQQDDGLFWHARSTPWFWGRGNGFAALGYAETLTYLPGDHPERGALMEQHVRHLEALRSRQHPSGMYPQVLDTPGSYHEFTATCMAGYAMARALRRGWLDESYRESVDRAWRGVTERIDDAGGLVDCCTDTGAQDGLQAYLDRPAVFGRDNRGGSMAMWFALEMEQLRRAQAR